MIIIGYIREQFHFKNQFPFIVFETTAKQALIHCHDCLEINYVKSGSGQYIIEQKIYPIEEGDIFIINNFERHMAVHGDDFNILVMVFDSKFIWEKPNDYDYLGPFFNRNTEFSNRIWKKNDNYLELCGYIRKIENEYMEQKDGWQLVIKATVMLFLAVLYRYYQNNNELGGDIRNSYKLYDRIYPILDYVNECFTETIELKELAKRTMMNKTYMCSYFKEVMSMTIFEYIMQVRINHGCLLLKTTNDTVTEIALKSGFNSAPYYNRVFKSIIGMSPNRYREKSKYSANTSEFAER